MDEEGPKPNHDSKLSRYKHETRRRERRSNTKLPIINDILFIPPEITMSMRLRSNSKDLSPRSTSDNTGNMSQGLVRQGSNLEISATRSSDIFPRSNSMFYQIVPENGTNEGNLPPSRKVSVKSIAEEEFENDFEKYSYKAKCKLEELVETEKTYVQSLKEIVEGYFDYMEASKSTPIPEGMVQMPQDLKGGKDRIVFGNIRDIYEYHTKVLLKEFEKCLDDVTLILRLFKNRKDHLKTKYGKFCINKPKSEYIISQYNHYFSLIRIAKDYKHSLNSHLMTPVQRVTRYPLLLEEMSKLYRKAGDIENQAIVEKAFDIANEIAEYANNMMEAGRITGFEGDVTRQGLLLMCGEEVIHKRRKTLKKPKARNCQIYVFQESIIICEKEELQGSFRPKLNFWVAFQMNRVKAREDKRSSDHGARFELERHDGDRGKVVKVEDRVQQASDSRAEKSDVNCIVIQCATEDKRNKWLKVINDQIRELQSFANSLENPGKFNG